MDVELKWYFQRYSKLMYASANKYLAYYTGASVLATLSFTYYMKEMDLRNWTIHEMQKNPENAVNMLIFLKRMYDHPDRDTDFEILVRQSFNSIFLVLTLWGAYGYESCMSRSIWKVFFFNFTVGSSILVILFLGVNFVTLKLHFIVTFGLFVLFWNVIIMIFLTGILRDPFSYDSLKSSMENLLNEGLKYTREDLDRQKYFNSIIHKVYAKTRCRYIFLYSDVMTLLIGLHFVPVYINFVEHQLGNKTFDAPHEFAKLSNTSLLTIIITLVAFLCIILRRLVFVLEAKARRYLLLPWFIFFVCLAAYHCYFGVTTFFYYPWEHKRFLLLISNVLFFKLHIEMCKGMYQYYKLISDEGTGISDENSHDHND